jgi:hypothetical protein
MPDSLTAGAPIAALPPLEDVGPEWLLERMRERHARGERHLPQLYLSASVETLHGELNVSQYLDLTIDEVLGVLRARKARAALSVVE